MTNRHKLLFQNLKMTALSMCVFGLFGFVFSLVIAMAVYPSALAFKIGISSSAGIHLAQLDAFQTMQLSTVLICAIIGAVAAQVVFVLSHGKEGRGDANHVQQGIR